MRAAADRFWIALAAVLAWIVADLYLPFALPGAGTLEHLAFRSVGAVVRALEEEAATDILVLDVVLAVSVLVGVVALIGWNAGGRRLWRVGAVGFAAAQAGVIVVALLMERASGLSAVVLVAVLGVFPRTVAGSPPSRRAGLSAFAIGLVPLVYGFAVFTASSDGYGLLALLEALGGDELRQVTQGLILLVGGSGYLLLGDRRPPVGRLAVGLGAALGVGLVLKWVLDPGLPGLSALVLGPAAGLLWAGIWARVGGAGVEPLHWPRLLLGPLLAAAVLFAHTYGARVFACPEQLPEGVERVAEGDDVFEVVLGRSGDVLLMSSRSGRRFLALDTHTGQVTPVAPDAVPVPPDGSGHSGETLGYAEEIEYLPEQDQFLGTLVAVGHDFFEQENSPVHDVNNALVHIDGGGAAAQHLHGQSRMCWVGNMRWDPYRARVLLGCEYDPRIWTYEPITQEVAYGFESPDLADVAAFAVDTRPGGTDIYTVSMWTGDRITRLGGDGGLEIQGQAKIGDAHYALEMDSGTGRLFASSYYRSAVTVVDADTLAVVDRIPTGLGARAVGVDSRRGLVLASSVYDGLVRVCDTATAEVLANLRVGGHVKDVAVDEERGLAWFANPCGVYKVDLSGFGR